MRPLPEHVTPIFDGQCGFCTRSARIVQPLGRHGNATAIPYQKPGAPETPGLSLEKYEVCH